MKHVLDLGCGKDWDKWLQPLEEDSGENKINTVTCVDKGLERITDTRLELVAMDIFEFLEKECQRKYTHVFAERVFEHIPYDKLSYLFYLLYEVCVFDAKMIFIVPNYSELAKHIINFNTVCSVKEFNKKLIDLHTEVFNEPHDPHQSIWTPELAKYWLELEDYWTMSKIKPVKRDGRDWYMEVEAYSRRTSSPKFMYDLID